MSIQLERIGWENLPSKKTPINKINLTKMEQNTEDAINTLALEVEYNTQNISDLDNMIGKNEDAMQEHETLINNKLNITDKATQEDAEAGTNNNKYMTPQSTKQAIDKSLEGYTPSGENVAYLDTIPIGVVMEWYSDEIPNGFLLCNGQAVSRSEYSELFAVIGTTNGPGDGSTTFNVPDRRGRTGVGKNENDADFDTLGKLIGEKEHTLTIDEMPQHNHSLKSVSSINMITDFSTFGIVRGNSAHDVEIGTNQAGNGQAFNITQKSTICNYIIKAKTIKAVPNISEIEMMPVGTVLEFEGTDIPKGWEAVEEAKWVELTILHDKLVKRPSSERNYAPSCKKIGDIVYVTGQLRAIDTITDSHAILNIPEGYRPSSEIVFQIAGVNVSAWLLPNGNMSIDIKEQIVNSNILQIVDFCYPIN